MPSPLAASTPKKGDMEVNGESKEKTSFTLPTSAALGIFGVVGAVGLAGFLTTFRKPKVEPELPSYFANQGGLATAKSTLPAIKYPEPIPYPTIPGVYQEVELPPATPESRRAAYRFAITTLGLGTALALSTAAIATVVVGWSLGVKDLREFGDLMKAEIPRRFPGLHRAIRKRNPEAHEEEAMDIPLSVKSIEQAWDQLNQEWRDEQDRSAKAKAERAKKA